MPGEQKTAHFSIIAIAAVQDEMDFTRQFSMQRLNILSKLARSYFQPFS